MSRASSGAAPGLPASPFHAVLGFCPRHQAACFTGQWSSVDGGDLTPGMRELLRRGVEADVSECVADNLGDELEGVGAIPVRFMTANGTIVRASTDGANAMGVPSAVQSRIFRCVADALGRLCTNEGEPAQRVFDVQLMVQRPHQRHH